jgi:hypothetical protein
MRYAAVSYAGLIVGAYYTKAMRVTASVRESACVSVIIRIYPMKAATA